METGFQICKRSSCLADVSVASFINKVDARRIVTCTDCKTLYRNLLDRWQQLSRKMPSPTGVLTKFYRRINHSDQFSSQLQCLPSVDVSILSAIGVKAPSHRDHHLQELILFSQEFWERTWCIHTYWSAVTPSTGSFSPHREHHGLKYFNWQKSFILTLKLPEKTL